jgi:hypothetical protein
MNVFALNSNAYSTILYGDIDLKKVSIVPFAFVTQWIKVVFIYAELATGAPRSACSDYNTHAQAAEYLGDDGDVEEEADPMEYGYETSFLEPYPIHYFISETAPPKINWARAYALDDETEIEEEARLAVISLREHALVVCMGSPGQAAHPVHPPMSRSLGNRFTRSDTRRTRRGR